MAAKKKNTASPDASGSQPFADRFVAYQPVLDRLLFVLGLLGILVVVHLWLQTGRGFDRGCLGFSEPSPTFDCEAVVGSEAGRLFGVSNIVWGLIFYLLVAWMGAAVMLVGDALRVKIKQARAVLITFGFLYSAYLFFVQYVQIGEFCLLCLISALLAATLFVAQVFALVKRAPGVSGDVRARLKGEPRLFAALAGAFVLLIVADVAYFKSLPPPVTANVETEATASEAPGVRAAAETPAPAPAECRYKPDVPYVTDYVRFISIADPFQGRSDAPVTVIEFFDPSCPHCKALHPIMKRVVEENGDRAKFYFVPYLVFPYSMLQVEGLYVAAQEGKYFEMIDAQFTRQRKGGLDMRALREIAAGLGLDPDRFQASVERGAHLDQIRAIREDLRSLGIRGVPTVMINGRVVDGESRTVRCISELIREAAASDAGP
jgi:protein-disulfide isomerase/uncharacterized membrane protein